MSALLVLNNWYSTSCTVQVIPFIQLLDPGQLPPLPPPPPPPPSRGPKFPLVPPTAIESACFSFVLYRVTVKACFKALRLAAGQVTQA